MKEAGAARKAAPAECKRPSLAARSAVLFVLGIAKSLGLQLARWLGPGGSPNPSS